MFRKLIRVCQRCVFWDFKENKNFLPFTEQNANKKCATSGACKILKLVRQDYEGTFAKAYRGGLCVIPKLRINFCSRILSVQNLLSLFLGIMLSLILNWNIFYLAKLTLIFDISLREREFLLRLLNIHKTNKICVCNV